MTQAITDRHDRPAVAASDTDRQGLSPGWQVVVFCVVLLATVSRRPGMFLHPQFFAEDGTFLFAQAYNLHWWHSVLLPQAGYLLLLQRLVAGLALLFPLLWAPLIFNVAGACFQVLPVTALLSRRCSPWGPLSIRMVMAAAYVAIPNASEVHVVLTNAMWHLALLQIIMATSLPPSSWRGRAADILLFGIGGLSGPFCLLLLLPVGLYWWFRRQRWTLVVLGIIAACVVIQGWMLLSSVRAAPTPLGATPFNFLRLLAGNVFLNSLKGARGQMLGPHKLLAAAILGLLVLFWGWRNAPLSVRLAMVFAALVFAVSLKDPLVLGPRPRWVLISEVDFIRYWFFPSLAFLWAVIWCCAKDRPVIARYLGYAAFLLFVRYAHRSWTYPPWPDNHYREHVAVFRHAKPGDRVVFSLYPENWTMTLVKH